MKYKKHITTIARNLIYLFVVLTIFSCSSSKPPKEVTTYKIGAIFPLTGEVASFGQNCRKGIEIALNERNNAAAGSQIQIIYEDNKGDPKSGVSAMEKLININKVPVVLGGMASSIALAEAPIANRNLVVLMCTFASSPEITNAGDYVFRIMPSDAYQGLVSADWVNALGYKKVAILYTHNDWGLALKDVFEENFSKLGKIVHIEGINPEEKDFRSVLTKIKEKQPDAIFMPTYPKEGAILVKQAKELGINAKIFGGDPWANEDFIKGAGDSAESVLYTAPMKYQGQEYQHFAQVYKEKYKEEPDLSASAGYDSIRVIIFAIENLENEKKEITGQNIKNILYTVMNFPGATGLTTFDENGDVKGKGFAKMVIKNGKSIEWTK